MFGTYRTILAALVVIQHFGVIKLGHLAVLAFFCLSGFLMTLLMDGPYRGRIKAFAANRFLRLYPIYFFTLAVTAALLLAGFAPSRRDIGIPDDAWGWLKELTYIKHWQDRPQFVPTAWAVSNEMLWYALIALGISATTVRAAVWLAASVVFMTLVFTYAPRGSDLFYFSPLAASLPFAFGATVYHLRSWFERHRRSWLVLGLLLSIGSLVGTYVTGRAWTWQLMHLFGAGLMVASLFHIKPIVSEKLAELDDKIGIASYPIYLGHFAVAMILGAFMPIARGHEFGLLVLAGSSVFAAISYALVDAPIEKVRTRIRQASARNAGRVKQVGALT